MNLRETVLPLLMGAAVGLVLGLRAAGSGAVSTYRYPSPIELARQRMQRAERRDDRRKWRAVLGGLTAAENRKQRERSGR